jgi:hypothetical protein
VTFKEEAALAAPWLEKKLGAETAPQDEAPPSALRSGAQRLSRQLTFENHLKKM